MEVCEIPEVYNEQNCNEKGDAPFQGGEITDIDIKEVLDEIKEEKEYKLPDYNQQLRDRIIMLRATLYELKKQLKEEKESWNREIQYICSNQPESYADNNFRHTQNMTYEEIKQMHQESKASLQRQLAITNYKRRLLEVENMCNMELMRVKQSVKFLQPLQEIVSEWNCDNGTPFNGQNLQNESLKEAGDAPGSPHASESSTDSEETVEKKVEKKDSMPLELISTKLYNEMNDMFNVLSAHCQATIPNWNEANALQAVSAVAVSECGQGEN